MFRHLMRKLYLKMDQEIQVYFMINLHLVGNEPGLHYGKRNTFLMFIFGYKWSYIKKESECLLFIFKF